MAQHWKSAGREAAIQMMYHRIIAGDSTEKIAEFFHVYETDLKKKEFEFAVKLLKTASDKEEFNTETLKRFISDKWDISRMSAVELAVLYIGLSELFEENVAVKIIMDEYTSHARAFVDEKFAGFVNGLLSKVRLEFGLKGGEDKED